MTKKEYQCDGKKKYTSRKKAKYDSRRLGIIAYFCEYCHYYHIGHKPLEARRNSK